jgi:DNA-binding GntR family transcriptional regulator
VANRTSELRDTSPDPERRAAPPAPHGKDRPALDALQTRRQRTEKALTAVGRPDAGSLNDAAYNGILDLVLSRDLRPGERTSVNLLADRLGLGRMPVKEAINRLQSEGLLSVKGRSGTTVTSIDAAGAVHMFALRRALEDFAADLAARNVTASELAQIKGLLKEMRQTSIEAPHRPGAGPRFVKANAAFHALVIGAAHNPFLDQAYARLQLQFQIVSYLTQRGQNLHEAERRQAEHEEILDTLARRDGKALREVQRRHGASTERSLLKHLK